MTMRLEFKNVKFYYLHGHMVPMWDFDLPCDHERMPLQYLLDKAQLDKLPAVKMTLEWEENINAKGGD